MFTGQHAEARTFVLGISGASGAVYSLRLLEQLLALGHTVHVVVSDYGKRLLFDEAHVRQVDFENLLPRLATDPLSGDARRRLILHSNRDVGAVIASGSYVHHGMVVLPCSSASLGQIATGSGSHLLCRAAMVSLKERRPLILCHREMPLSHIDIENYHRLSLSGAIMCPPNPGYYLHPRSVGDLVDFVVGKVLDLLHVEHALKTRWAEAIAAAGED